MADTASATPAAPEPVKPEPVQSIEVKTEIKEEDGEDKSDHEEDGAEAANGEEPAVTNEQYKALKNITDVLTNYKTKLKGDEYARASKHVTVSGGLICEQGTFSVCFVQTHP